MKALLFILSHVFIIGGVIGARETQVDLLNWQFWCAWITIWVGVNCYAESKKPS